MKKISAFLLIVCLFLFSCSSSAGDSPKSNEQQSVEKTMEGENLLRNGSITDAISSFESALNLDSLNVSAYAGLGWSHIITASINTARLTLVQGLGLDTSSAEIISGLAFIYNALGDTNSLTLSIQYAETLITIDSDWVSLYGFDFSITDVYIVLAQSHYLLGHFSESLQAIQKVDSLFTADIETEIGRTSLSEKIESYNSGITKK